MNHQLKIFNSLTGEKEVFVQITPVLQKMASIVKKYINLCYNSNRIELGGNYECRN